MVEGLRSSGLAVEAAPQLLGLHCPHAAKHVQDTQFFAPHGHYHAGHIGL